MTSAINKHATIYGNFSNTDRRTLLHLRKIGGESHVKKAKSKEWEYEVRYLRNELEAAKLLAAKSLTDYDEMKLDQQYYKLLYSKVTQELDSMKKEQENVLALIKQKCDIIRQE